MKGLRWIVAAILLSLCSLSVGANVVPAQEYTIDTPYEYPILPGTQEWADLFTHGAMLRACQIPEDILQAMTTEALVETVVNYPLAADVYAYDTFQMGYDAVKRQFNGLRELERRPDALSVMAAKMTATMNLTEEEKTFKDYWRARLFSACFQE